jgi:hypothetical protein
MYVDKRMPLLIKARITFSSKVRAGESVEVRSVPAAIVERGVDGRPTVDGIVGSETPGVKKWTLSNTGGNQFPPSSLN